MKCSLAICTMLLTSSLMAQENGTSSFATVGRYEHQTWAGRGAQLAVDKWNNHLDKVVCCGYGKSHNDNGVPGYRGTKTFIWGSACEFFTEPCRTPPPPLSKKERRANELYGNDITSSCTSCNR